MHSRSVPLAMPRVSKGLVAFRLCIESCLEIIDCHRRSAEAPGRLGVDASLCVSIRRASRGSLLFDPCHLLDRIRVRPLGLDKMLCRGCNRRHGLPFLGNSYGCGRMAARSRARTICARANDIDGEVLRRLTADDLRELGVASIGHRRRLLDAITAFRAAEPPSAPAAIPAAVGEAERRQLTVMFCDLVGSTPLTRRFDPEDLREVIGAYHCSVTDTVARFAGFVAKYMGDGVLVYFGYPEAHEDDAERAVRAGLAVIEAIGGLAAPEALNVRLGIASGLVVVGDLIGAGAAQERGVVGETPNLAARLQALAHRARSSSPRA